MQTSGEACFTVQPSGRLAWLSSYVWQMVQRLCGSYLLELCSPVASYRVLLQAVVSQQKGFSLTVALRFSSYSYA